MSITKKTGKKSWRPAQMLHTMNEQAGFRYRWCDKDPANLDKKQAEGWEFVKSSKSSKPDATTPASSDIDYADQTLTSLQEYRELIRMRLPEDIAEGRDEYYKEITDRQTAMTPKERVQQMAAQTGINNLTLID